MASFKLNKWMFLAFSSLIALAGYGINELSGKVGNNIQSLISKEYIDLRTNDKDASPQDLDTSVIPLSSTTEETADEDEDETDSENIISEPSQQLVIQDTKIATSPEADISYSDYTGDEYYVTHVLWYSSMGGKFKDYVILAPKDAKIGNYKAQKVKERAKVTDAGDHSRGLGRRGNYLYNAGNREDMDMDKLDGNKIHSLCTSILYENDYGIYFNRISGLSYKGFFDFVWEVCGREDKSKPSNGRFAQQ